MLIAFVLSLPLVFNPGYFSHDELQWLAFADKPSLDDVPWSAWFDFSPFQYRPLTFNLWLLLSHFIGYQPIAVHLVRVLFGLAAAWLLRSVLLQFGVAPRRATLACWIWLLTPYTVYTHGWVGTFGDSLCLVFMLLALRHALMLPHTDSWKSIIGNALPTAALTALALMSKESAVVFPAVMLIAALRRRDRAGVAAFATSAVIVLIYMALRSQTILYPHDATNGYHWSLANIPARLAEYAVFPFLIGHFEVIASRTHLTNWPALLGLGIVMAASLGAGWRRGLIFWIGWIAALGPVLILDDAYNQYAYLAGAWACAFLAWTWPRIRTTLRLLMVLPIAMLLIHGVQQIRDIRQIGMIQQNLYADLPGILANATRPIAIQAERSNDDFILQRLLTDIPSYQRVLIGERVRFIAHAMQGSQTDYRMSRNGHLVHTGPDSAR
ncbi:MAG TPA: hypothetical protein VLK26_10390 [Rudaea sp.]|nr:hypothetical protein [Rudaea sp.]